MFWSHFAAGSCVLPCQFHGAPLEDAGARNGIPAHAFRLRILPKRERLQWKVDCCSRRPRRSHHALLASTHQRRARSSTRVSFKIAVRATTRMAGYRHRRCNQRNTFTKSAHAGIVAGSMSFPMRCPSVGCGMTRPTMRLATQCTAVVRTIRAVRTKMKIRTRVSDGKFGS